MDNAVLKIQYLLLYNYITKKSFLEYLYLITSHAFTWSFDSNNKLTQIITYQSGAGVIPQYCNILILNETTLKYNNDGWRAEYTLIRVN